MDKIALMACLKKMPKDATDIRVGKLWSRSEGSFSYVSFVTKDVNVIGAFWRMAAVSSQPKEDQCRLIHKEKTDAPS